MKYLLLALFFFSWPAMAQTLCQTREQVVRHLGTKYSEKPIGIGVTSNGSVVELLTSETTWTIILTVPAGCVFFVAAGENWTALVPKKGRPI